MMSAHMTLMVLTIMLHSGYNMVVADTNCPTDSDCISADQFKLSTEIIGNNIEVTWTFNESISIYGFKPVIYSTDMDILYESPMLHFSQRFMSISHELEGENNICIHVYKNSTDILSKQCEQVKVPDYKVIIGILAGVIFLIPCLVGLSYVIYKDYKKTKEASYMDTEEVKKYLIPAIATTSVKGEEVILKVTLVDSERYESHEATNAAYKPDDIEHLEHTETNRKVDVAQEVDEEDVDSTHSDTADKLNIENEIDEVDNSAEENEEEEESLNVKKPVEESLNTKKPDLESSQL